MGVSSLVDEEFSQSRKSDEKSISAYEANTATLGIASLETGNLDSDAFWVAMIRQQNREAVRKTSIWRFFHRDDETDRQCSEVEQADRKNFLDLLRKSYARRADTIVWSMIVFILAVVVLIPFLGFLIGTVFAAFVSLCWSAVHRVRRL